jgi:diadenosine tetraphosphate (Ap4A) HIT family hydrolase
MWWTDEEWSAMSDADTCGMCADMHLEENEHSVLVASTPMTHTRLVRNQAHPGYSLVILRQHITDLADLTAERLSGFWSDVQRTGRTIQTVYRPRKIDYLVMGHRMPHLHCHVFPQHSDDDPTRNVDISDGPVIRPIELLRDDAGRLRQTWLATGAPD